VLGNIIHQISPCISYLILACSVPYPFIRLHLSFSPFLSFLFKSVRQKFFVFASIFPPAFRSVRPGYFACTNAAPLQEPLGHSVQSVGSRTAGRCNFSSGPTSIGLENPGLCSHPTQPNLTWTAAGIWPT